MAVQLTVERVITPAFTRAVSRLAECRTFEPKEHEAVVRLVFKVKGVLDKARLLKGANKLDELSQYIAEDLTCEDCFVSRSACHKASLSPSDTIALGELIKGE